MKPGKTVADSAVSEQIYKIFPNDLNHNGNVFGGQIMAKMDRMAVVVAERHAGCLCVTVGVDAVHFIQPATGADTLIYSAACNRAWNSSMEIGVRVMAELSRTGARRHILSAYLTFIALDENDKPTPVPQLIAESRAEKLRFQEAALRREARLEHAREIDAHRASREQQDI
ncbi:MAG: acyl-CoA thioesterase [Oceanococcus sp.]